jgi:hypothetical protein
LLDHLRLHPPGLPNTEQDQRLLQVASRTEAEQVRLAAIWPTSQKLTQIKTTPNPAGNIRD